MDRNYLIEMFGGREYPDGTFVIDYIDEIIEFEKAFMNVVTETRKTMMMTFPILTFSLLWKDGKFADEDFARWCSDHNTEWMDSNFFVSEDITSLSSCCFDRTQEVIVKVNGELTLCTFKQLYERVVLNTITDLQILCNRNKDEYAKGKIVRLPKRKMFNVLLKNTEALLATDNHIHVLADDSHKTTNQLQVGDKLKSTLNDEGVEIISISPHATDDKYVYCFEMEDKENPYFELENGIITHNCRMINDTSKLDAFINSIGGTALSIGSVKVNTINLRRIALLAKGDKQLYLELLKERVELCMKVLATVRHIIKRNVEKGILTNYQQGLIEMEKQYCTIGITAMYETLDEFGLINTDELGNKSYSEEGLKFACQILDLINEMKDSKEYDFNFNVECIPAENANVKLSYKDQLLFPYATCYPVYSNQWIPLIEKCTLNEKIKLSGLLDKKCGGGQ